MAGELAAMRALVGRFHEPGPPPEMTEKPASDRRRAIVLRLFVIRMTGLDARAAEHAHRGPDAAQALGRDGELCHNPQHPPRFLTVGRVECLRIDEFRNLVGLTHAYARAG